MAVAGVLAYFLRFPSEGDLQLAGLVAAMWVVGWLVGRMYGAQLERERLRQERDLARRLADANSSPGGSCCPRPGSATWASWPGP